VNIVDVYENEYLGKTCLLVVMERMGEELFQRIKAKTSFSEKEASKITRRISLAIKFLHDRNIAHRDLKPENLLYKESGGDSEILKLTDFGFAREASTNSGLRSPCYTPYYVAPEILNSQSYGKSCDIWSLGVIVYILLSGQPPFYTQNGEAMSPGMRRRIKGGRYGFSHPLWRHVSSSAKDLINGCLQTDVAKRWTIDQVLSHDWIDQFVEVKINLASAEMMSPETADATEEMKSVDVEEDVSDYLEEIREEPKQHSCVKKLKLGSSALMKRRITKMLGHFTRPSAITKL
jgi:serine/threonine protein kinase